MKRTCRSHYISLRIYTTGKKLAERRMKTFPWYRHKTPRTGSAAGSSDRGRREKIKRVSLITRVNLWKCSLPGEVFAERELVKRGEADPTHKVHRPAGMWWLLSSSWLAAKRGVHQGPVNFTWPQLKKQFCLRIGGGGVFQETEIWKHPESSQRLG